MNSLTKSFGLAGLRVGWLLADPGTIERARRVRDVVDGSGAVPSERLGVAAFEHIDTLLARARSILEPDWKLVKRFVDERPELDWVAPAVGSCVAFPRLVGVEDAEPFVEMARTEHGVGVVPGRFFGAPAHFRIAMAGRRDVLEAGLEALGAGARPRRLTGAPSFVELLATSPASTPARTSGWGPGTARPGP